MPRAIRRTTKLQNFLLHYPAFQESQFNYIKHVQNVQHEHFDSELGTTLEVLDQLIDRINFGEYARDSDRSIMSKISSTLHKYIRTLRKESSAYKEAQIFLQKVGLQFDEPSFEISKPQRTISKIKTT